MAIGAPVGLRFPLPQHKRRTVPRVTEISSKTHLKAIEQIRLTTTRRATNNRDNLTQALLAGRLLVDIKANLGHGSWLKWLEDNIDAMGYKSVSNSPVRAAQYDMRLWKQMEPHRERMAELKLIAGDDDDMAFVNNLDDDMVTVATTVFYELSRKNVPEAAVELAFEAIAQHGEFTAPQVQRLITYSQEIEKLAPEHRDTAAKLYLKGMDNPTVVSAIPTLTSDHPEILNEMLVAGALSVPGSDEQVPLSGISMTDIKLAAGEAATEAALSFITRNAPIVDEVREVRAGHFEKIGVYEGTAAQVEHLLKQAIAGKGGKILRVVCYEQSDNGR